MGFFTCDILLPTPEECMSEVSCELIMKDLIIQTEHKGRQWTKVAVFEVAPRVYLSQYGQVLDTTSDFMNAGWSFNIMLDCEAFISVPNCLDVGGQKIPVIVTS